MGQCGLRIPRVIERIGCLRMAEFPGMGAGKLASISKPRSELSAWGFHKL